MHGHRRSITSLLFLGLVLGSAASTGRRTHQQNRRLLQSVGQFTPVTPESPPPPGISSPPPSPSPPPDSSATSPPPPVATIAPTPTPDAPPAPLSVGKTAANAAPVPTPPPSPAFNLSGLLGTPTKFLYDILNGVIDIVSGLFSWIPSTIVGEYPKILKNVFQEFNGVWKFIVDIPLNIIGGTLDSITRGGFGLPNLFPSGK